MFIILKFVTYILNPFALLSLTMNKLYENRIISSDTQNEQYLLHGSNSVLLSE